MFIRNMNKGSFHFCLYLSIVLSRAWFLSSWDAVFKMPVGFKLHMSRGQSCFGAIVIFAHGAFHST